MIIHTSTGYKMTQLDGYPTMFQCVALNDKPLPAERMEVLRLMPDNSFTDAATACEPCFWAGKVRTKGTE